MNRNSPPYDLPFLPDEDYLELLSTHQVRIRHIYFGLGLPGFPDARPWQASFSGPLDSLCGQLLRFPNARKRLLLNGRITDPRIYLDPASLQPLIRVLERLTERGALQGLVFADLYLAQALSDTAPGLCAALEAAPSVNCLIDSREKALSWLDRLQEMRFQPPRLLVPDRWLNRSLPLLRALADDLKAVMPEMEIYLLANEGCLYQCPYKLSHDLLISACHGREEHFRALGKLHSRRGCTRRFFNAPWELLKSPLIRPEDQHAYAGIVDGFKICGRTLGATHLVRIVRAYLSGSYAGNLLELLDAAEGLADVFTLRNQDIPADFLKRTGCCDKRCSGCGYCQSLAKELIVRRPVAGISG